MSFSVVPLGQLAAVVTSLEMVDRPRPRPLPGSALRLVEWPFATAQDYRRLFRVVGGPWLWASRLAMDDGRLLAVIRDPAVAIFAALDPTGIEAGLIELDFARKGECRIAFFGLAPAFVGRGEGRWLMAEALARAWRADIRRVWVHTCTLDHPAALGFYRSNGFVPFARALETFADPRLAGLLPRDAAPQIPLLDP